MDLVVEIAIAVQVSVDVQVVGIMLHLAEPADLKDHFEIKKNSV
jgi:hypothetical protein